MSVYLPHTSVLTRKHLGSRVREVIVMAVDTLKYDELLKKTFATLNSYVESEWPVVKQTVL